MINSSICYYFQGEATCCCSDSNNIFSVIIGTLWNLSSHDSVKMEIVDHALHALADEVVVPHSGWERGSNGGEESCKPRHLEWETALTNTAGCLRYKTDLSLPRRGRRDLFLEEHEIIRFTCLLSSTGM